jgi:ribosomal protein S12 methylthiotransferase
MSNKKPLTVGLVSLGCSKNLVDTQVMCGVLLTEGVELAPNPDEADVVLINTCAFIQSARDEADAEIRRAIGLKAEGKIGAIVVSGCLAQRYGKEVAEKYPDVDAWLGIDHLEELADVVKRVARKGADRKRAILKVSGPATALFEPRVPALSLAGGPFAYLKIAEGCNHACAYCAIPGIRGHLRSRKIDDIAAEAEELLATGVRELDIVAQDVTAYGRDKRGGGRLPELLCALDGFGGKYRTRILYGYPSLVDDALLNCFSSLKHLCRYIDIPVQHSHPDILRAMRRADTVKHVASLPARLRAACPGIAIRTTCLVGFPGETEEHFRHLCDYVRESRFDALGVFAFSCEEGTAAAAMPNQVPAGVAEERRDRLMRIQRKVQREAAKSRIGTKTTAMLLRPTSHGRWEARTDWQAPDVDGITFVAGCGPKAAPGDLMKVEIEAVRGYDLSASVCQGRAGLGQRVKTC